MKFLRNLPTPTRRDAWVEVDLGALERNARRLRELLPRDVELMAILKADAYGHGAVMCIPTLEASGISMVGVAAMDEAIQIREAGLEIPVLVIGAIPEWAMEVAARYDVALTIFSDAHLSALEKVYQRTGQRVRVHIKVDTGMHRIGIHWEEAAPFIRRCQSLPYLELEGVFSHLACAGDNEQTRIQQERFQQVLDALEVRPRYVHLANSAGALRYAPSRHNLVRCGIALFGYEEGFSPVMGLKARIMHLQDIPAGAGISYGYNYRPERPSKIATLPLGYADGIFRGLSNRMQGIVRGHRAPQVGAITMDQLMLDVTDIPNVSVGETVTLIGQDNGEQLTFTDWAQTLDTIEYELMCALRVRLPKTFTRP